MITVKKTYLFDPENDLIGTGGFGKVFRATDQNLNMEVAIKKYTGSLPSKYSLFEEIKRVIKLNHPNLVRYYDAFELDESTSFGDKIQVGVMEYVNGGDLLSLLNKRPRIDEETLKQLFIEIMEGLKYLHDHDIIHRDLKPENILIHEENGQYTPKIADFGISKSLREDNSGSSLVIGSLEYMAPEQFNITRYGKDRQLGTNLDLWSLGTIMYEAFTGKPLFGKTKLGIPRDEIMRNILDKDLSDLSMLPEPIQSIVRKCLVRSAEHRAQSVDELLDIARGKTPIIPNYIGSDTVLAGTSIMGRQGQRSQLPPPSVHEKIASQVINKPSDQKEEHGLRKPEKKEGFSWVYLLPIVTGIAGYAFFNSKQTIFGYNTPIGEYIMYPTLFCTVLALINLFSLFIRRAKPFELASYVFSFLVLIYYIGQGLILNHYESLRSLLSGVQFNFLENPYAKFYPLVGFAIVTLTILARIKYIRWFEMIPHALSYAFLFIILIGVLVTAKNAYILAGAMAAVCFVLAIIFALIRRN